MKPTNNGSPESGTAGEGLAHGHQTPEKMPEQGADGLNTSMNDELRDTRDDAINRKRKEAAQSGTSTPTAPGRQGTEQQAPRKGGEEGTFHKGGPDKS